MSDFPNNRTVLSIKGPDAQKFLQDLVTNDITNPGLTYAALLSAQGKYLFDFFVLNTGEKFLIDIQSDQAPQLAQRLTLYKLRANLEISTTDQTVTCGQGPAPATAHADPRHTALGWRHYGEPLVPDTSIDWLKIYVTNCIPQTGIELRPNESYILESSFERLSGVDFRKGCYVGQEVTARMKHKTELKKGLAVVSIQGATEIGTEITANGKSVGTVFSQSNGQAIAYLRFDRAQGTMTAGDATLTK